MYIWAKCNCYKKTLKNARKICDKSVKCKYEENQYTCRLLRLDIYVQNLKVMPYGVATCTRAAGKERLYFLIPVVPTLPSEVFEGE